MKKRVLFITLIILVFTLLVGCGGQASRVSRNLSKEADNFNVTRRLVVMNVRDNTIIMQAIGKISILVDSSDNQLEIVAETGPGVYEKNFVGLNPYITYSIEQVDPMMVSKYGYELEWMPESLIPIRITDND